jgi:hypothetical protein
MRSKVRSTIGKLRPAWTGRLRSEPGQGLIEYILIISVVSLGALLALGFFSGKINDLFSSNGNRINNDALAPPNGTVSGGGGVTLAGAGQPGTPAFTQAVFAGHACAYTTTYTYYAASTLTGHGGALNPNAQGYYTNGKQASTNVNDYVGTPATPGNPPFQPPTPAYTAAQNMAWCLSNAGVNASTPIVIGGFTIYPGVPGYGGLPANPPTTIDGYDCGSWHSTGSWTVNPQGTVSYQFGCYRGPVPTLAGSQNPEPYITCGNSNTRNCSGVTIRADDQPSSTLHAHDGVWLNNPTGFTETWLSCTGGTCTNVGTGGTYQPGHGDVNHTIELQVVATNVDGSSVPTLSSPPVGPVLEMLPPVCSGQCNPGVTSPDNPPIAGTTSLTANPDQPNWTPNNSALTFTYQWYSCADGTNRNASNNGNINNNATALQGCSPVGTGGNTYSTRSSDSGRYFLYTVIGTNLGGASSRYVSDKSAQAVAKLTTVNTPTIGKQVNGNGSCVATGGTISTLDNACVLSHATWTGSPGANSYNYQWEECDGSGNNCASAGTNSTVNPGNGDIGHTYKVQERANNGVWSDWSGFSGLSPAITTPPPPTLTGAAVTASPTNSTALRLTITANRNINCNTISTTSGVDLTLTGATFASVTGGTSSLVCTVNITTTVANNTSGTSSVALSGAFSVSDTNGIVATTASGFPIAWTVDRQAPTLTVARVGAATTFTGAGTVLQFTITGSETLNCSSITAGDFTVTRGTVTAVTPVGNAGTCTISVTSSAGVGQTVSVAKSIFGFGVTDVAGNNQTTTGGLAFPIVWTRTS